MTGLGLATAAVLDGSQRAVAVTPGQQPVTSTPLALTQPADPYLGTMTPSATAAADGMFAPQIDWPLIPIHAVLLANGRLISYGTPVGAAAQGGLDYDEWRPAAGTGTDAHAVHPGMDSYNSFCNGIQVMADGRLIMVGGNSSTATMTYDPADADEQMGAQLARQRWYTTVLRRPDNRILVLGGGNYYNTGAYLTPDDNSGVATTPEIGTGTSAWTSLTGATSTTAFGAARNRWWYPRTFNGPDGRVFGMSDDRMWLLADSGDGSIQDLGRLPYGPGVSGSAAMYQPGMILVAGGGQNMNTDDVVATNAAAIVNINRATPVAKATAPMANARNWLNLTVLANGEVLANGGTITGTRNGTANAVYPVEIWNPTSRAWRQGATATRIRTYHSTAVLLQSGAVFTGGGGVPGPEDNLNAELYYPPYLFTKGTDGVTRWADRVRLTSVSGSVTYGGTLTLTTSDQRKLSSATLIRLATVTHSVSTDQRRVPVHFTRRKATITITLPSDPDLLPPGSYALQVVDTAGVPSPAQTITMSLSGAGTVTVYELATASGGSGDSGTTGGTVPLTVGTAIGLEPSNYPGRQARHQNYAFRVDVLGTASPMLGRADSSLVVRSGLAGSGLSFEAVGFPGWFLVVSTGQGATLVQNDGSAGFARAATYLAVAGLAGQGTSLRLLSDAGAYLRQQDFVLRADTFDNSAQMRADATFRIKAALDPLPLAARISLEPDLAPGSALRHRNFVARIDPIDSGSPAGDRADATFIVRAALNGGAGVTLEAADFAGYYLRRSGTEVRLDPGDGSTAFAADASFCPVTGPSGTGVTLRDNTDAPTVVSSSGSTVSVTRLDGSEQSGDQATFQVLSPLA